MTLQKAMLPVLAILSVAFSAIGDSRPTLFLIGDSTVKNGQGTGAGKMWGWGSVLGEYFDGSKIQIENRAIGGRSSRSYRREGRWDKVLGELKPGDFVIMQFGHNDGGSVGGNKGRASLKGMGDETVEDVDEVTGETEVVHSYGWYMRLYIREAKAKGATAIVCSPVPRNIWVDGKVARNSTDYGHWSRQAAEAEDAFFIDLNELVAKRYDPIGDKDKLKAMYFVEDHTHTNHDGAVLNAECLVAGLKTLEDCPITAYLREMAVGIDAL